MNTELENALRDKIDCLTAQLTESMSKILKLKMRNFVITLKVIRIGFRA